MTDINDDYIVQDNTPPDEYYDTEQNVDDNKLMFFVNDGRVSTVGFSEYDKLINDLEDPINSLDPYVYHDVPTPQPFIIKLKNTVGAGDGVTNQTPDTNKSNIEGIHIPVVRLNTYVLDPEHIEALSIVYTGFVPECTLIVKDPSGKFKLNIRPGLNNLIQISIMPSVDGKYKKISLPFYITDVDMDVMGTEATFKGTLKHMPLIQHLLSSESISYKHCEQSINPNDKCSLTDTDKPNMWELFHDIAIRSELGFASMLGLKDYSDHTVRNISSQNYKEFLEYNLSIGGSNEQMIYDGWVDLYGYLVLVDVYKALHDDIQSSNLAVYAETGLHTHNELYPKAKMKSIRRVLTNSNMTAEKSNLEIEEFYNTSNIGKILDHGTLQTIYYFNPFGIESGINNIKASQIRIKEDSPDGEFTEDYEVQKYCGWSFVGCEDINISRQMEIRDAYLTKLRNSNAALTIRLKQPNYGLQRGTLLTIIRMRYDYQSKVRLLNQESNLYPDAASRGYSPDPDGGSIDNISSEDVLHNDAIGMIDPENSGIYYIDGMRFDYISGNDHIQQYLYLIRRDRLASLNNLSTFNRFKYPTDKS